MNPDRKPLDDSAQTLSDLSDPIGFLARGEFRWGQCQARLYDPREPDWPQPFLYHLYEQTRLSGQRHPLPLDLNNRATLGPIPLLFCGMTNLGPDAISKYLSERAVCVVGEWRSDQTTCYVTDGSSPEVRYEEGPERFHPLGYCFPSTPVTTSPLSLTSQPVNSVFAGYTIFSEAWRTPQQRVLMFLGLAWLFSTFSLAAIHGSRYGDNHLTARWTRQFGFRDCGTLPHCLTAAADPTGPLVPATFSALLREDFERLLRETLTLVLGRTMEHSADSPAPTPAASSTSPGSPGSPASLKS